MVGPPADPGDTPVTAPRTAPTAQVSTCTRTHKAVRTADRGDTPATAPRTEPATQVSTCTRTHQAVRTADRGYTPALESHIIS